MMEWVAHNNASKIAHESALKVIVDLEHQFNSDDFLILITGSFGDVIVSLLLIQEFSLRQPDSSIVCILPEGYNDFCQRFVRTRTIRYVFIRRESIFLVHRCLVQTRMPFRLLRGRLFPLLLTLHPFIAEAVLSGRMLDFEAKRLLLELPPRTPIVFTYCPTQSVRAREIFSNSKLPIGRTLIISPVAQSNQSIEPQLVTRLVRAMRDRYGILINAPEGTSEQYERILKAEGFEVPVLSLPPHLVFEFIRLAGFYLGGAHGLTSLLTCFDGSTKVVMLREMYIHNKNLSDPIQWNTMRDVLDCDIHPSHHLLELVLEGAGSTTSDDWIAEAQRFFTTTSSGHTLFVVKEKVTQ